MIFNLVFRQTGQGTAPQAESLARNVEMRLNELLATVNQAINRVEKSGIQQPAPTVVGRLEQARRWLEQPGKKILICNHFHEISKSRNRRSTYHHFRCRRSRFGKTSHTLGC